MYLDYSQWSVLDLVNRIKKCRQWICKPITLILHTNNLTIWNTCRIKTGHSNLGSCFGPRIRVLAWYFTEAKAGVKYRASARIRGPKHDTRFEWPVSILIMIRCPFQSAKNPRVLTIASAMWFCRYPQSTPSQLWMHAPVAKERRLMTSQYPIFDRMDNLNPQWMQALNG